DELIMIGSFSQLINMRLEAAFHLDINITEPFLSFKLPHLSLQPLLENAVKHNASTVTNPVKVVIYITPHQLVFSNSLCKIQSTEMSNGVGLVNLNERFKIMLG